MVERSGVNLGQMKIPGLFKPGKRVKEHFGIQEEEIRTKGLKKNIPRQITIYLVRKYSDTGINNIGKYFGEIEYSAVSQTVGRLEKKRGRDSSLDKTIREIERILK